MTESEFTKKLLDAGFCLAGADIHSLTVRYRKQSFWIDFDSDGNIWTSTDRRFFSFEGAAESILHI